MKESAILKIGDDVDIFVQHIGGGQVRLCISAPREVSIKHLPPELLENAEIQYKPARRKNQG